MQLEINIWIVMAILLAHYLGDFVMQSHWMASNKSRSTMALLSHVVVYTLVVCVVLMFATSLCEDYLREPDVMYAFGNFAILTFASHLVVDYATAPVNSALYKSEAHHEFFVVVGADQVVHLGQLLLTYQFFVSPALT